MMICPFFALFFCGASPIPDLVTPGPAREVSLRYCNDVVQHLYVNVRPDEGQDSLRYFVYRNCMYSLRQLP